MFNIFKQKPNTLIKNPYNTDETIEYLNEARDYFGMVGFDCLAENKSRLDILLAFTYSSAALAAMSLVREVPETSIRIAYVFEHLRAFYDCEWQSFFLHTYNSDSDRKKLMNLWPQVSLRQLFFLTEVNNKNNLFLNCISKIPDSERTRESKDSIKEYINGVRKYPVKGDYFIAQNIDALSLYIIEISGVSILHKNIIFARMLNVYENNPANIFINQFDFKGLKDIPLPASWLAKQ